MAEHLGDAGPHAAVLVERGIGLDGVRLECGLGKGRLDDCNANATGAQFVIKRFRIAFYGVFAGGIQRDVRHGHDAQNRADIDNPAAALAAHVRHHGAGHAHHAKEVGIEERLGLFDRAFFCAGRGNADTGIVHQQIDTPFKPDQLADRRRYGRVIRDIERQHPDGALRGLGPTPAGAINLVTGLLQPLGRGFANAR